MSQELPFSPLSFISDPHHQTIIGSFFNFFWEPYSERRIISLPDGDKLALEITTPRCWQASDLTVLMVHGLCGSHKSPNLVRMSKRLENKGIRAIRLNLRGCGSGKGMAKRMYHSGSSDDVFEAIKAIRLTAPVSPLLLVGFSLGGNISLKLAGELGTLAGDFLAGVIAISPPVDLYSSVEQLGKAENAMYERYFIRLLRADLHYRQRVFRDLPRIYLPKGLKLYEFDQLYTAPYYGFKDAHDYYNKCSALPLVSDIAIPCQILLAEDDPIVPSFPLDSCSLPKNVNVFKTKQGGHLGYLGNPTHEKGLYWLDWLLMDWIGVYC